MDYRPPFQHTHQRSRIVRFSELNVNAKAKGQSETSAALTVSWAYLSANARGNSTASGFLMQCRLALQGESEPQRIRSVVFNSLFLF